LQLRWWAFSPRRPWQRRPQWHIISPGAAVGEDEVDSGWEEEEKEEGSRTPVDVVVVIVGGSGRFTSPPLSNWYDGARAPSAVSLVVVNCCRQGLVDVEEEEEGGSRTLVVVV